MMNVGDTCAFRNVNPQPSSAFFLFLLPRQQRSPLFPYTTLFRSHLGDVVRDDERADAAMVERDPARTVDEVRSEEHTSELQSRVDLVCRLLLEKKNNETQPLDLTLLTH